MGIEAGELKTLLEPETFVLVLLKAFGLFTYGGRTVETDETTFGGIPQDDTTVLAVHDVGVVLKSR